jgi:hypothetical protein
MGDENFMELEKLKELQEQANRAWGLSVCDDGEAALDILDELLRLMIAQKEVQND